MSSSVTTVRSRRRADEASWYTRVVIPLLMMAAIFPSSAQAFFSGAGVGGGSGRGAAPLYTHTTTTTTTSTPKSTPKTSKQPQQPPTLGSTPPRMKVSFVTSNPLKTREVQALLAEGGLQVPFDVQTADIHLPELQEDPITIAIEKTRLAAQFMGGPVLVEDTSLQFSALNGLPGPYIKFFLEGIGNEGLYKMVAPYEDKTAAAVCNVGWCLGPGHEPVIFSGVTHGTIVPPAEEDADAFGWDVIFLPQGFDVTFAKMTISEKNAISHRSLALRAFQTYITEEENLTEMERVWRETHGYK